MKELLDSYAKHISKLKEGIDAELHFSSLSYVHTTSSGYDRIFRAQDELIWYKKEYERLSRYKQCTCSGLRKYFNRWSSTNRVEENPDIYKCKKCGGYHI